MTGVGGKAEALFGYQGKWAWINLTDRTVRVETADDSICRDYIGGRGVQARLIYDHLGRIGRLTDPLSPANRLVIGSAALNDSRVATASRGSCSFISPMTQSPQHAPWVPDHQPLYGLLTHSSAGGVFHNMLKRAGLDQLIIDGRADRPVRLLVADGDIRIVDAEEELFEHVGGSRIVRTASAMTGFLTAKYPGSSTICLGPAGWNGVAFACLTNDHHRNFGRGGAGAVFGSKNLVAITARGRRRIRCFDENGFEQAAQEIDRLIAEHAADPARTSSFRPATGTTWWLDRAFRGGYLGQRGGYLPFHNFDEGYFDESDYAKVGTDAFLAIAGRHLVCNRCRHIMCTRSARVQDGPYAGEGVRPEFETVALFINCCIFDREGIFHINKLCNELGIDTMTAGSVISGAMEMNEKGMLAAYPDAPSFGSAADTIRTLEAIAYRSNAIGRLLGAYSDQVVAEVAAGRPQVDIKTIARAVTTIFGGLGYAGVEPKVFPAMFAAYSTSNRGRGDHTYAWTVQAEEGGLSGAENLAAYVAAGQWGKALVDSLGLCDFFPEDIYGEAFLRLYQALTGFEYSAQSMQAAGRRIYGLERLVNNLQGRTRNYDAFIPPKLMVSLTDGPHAGKSVDPRLHAAILDAYYVQNGWTKDGVVPSRA